MNKVVVRHFHAGNDPDRACRGSEPGQQAIYATQARIVNLETGETVEDETYPEGHPRRKCEEWSFCNPRDVPSRAVGRLKAVRRLQGHHPELCAESKYSIGLEYLSESTN